MRPGKIFPSSGTGPLSSQEQLANLRIVPLDLGKGAATGLRSDIGFLGLGGVRLVGEYVIQDSGG